MTEVTPSANASNQDDGVSIDQQPHGGSHTQSALKKSLDPGFKRNLKIIGGVFVVAAILIFVIVGLRSGGGDKNKDGQVDMSLRARTQSLPDDTELSPAMKESITKQLEKERQEAQQKGEKIYLPSDILEPARPIPKGEESVGLPVQPSTVTLPQVVEAPLTEAEKERIARRRAGIEKQLGMIVNTMESARMPPARTNFSQVSSSQDVRPSVGESSSVPSTVNQAAPTSVAGPVLIDAMEIVAAETATAVDTYQTKYTSARIMAGKLAGAFLVGKVSEQNEGLRVEYNLMRVGDKTYNIQAIALDEKTSIDAMGAANVDKRYLQRWVFPVLTAAVGAFANASAQPGSTAVTSPTGTTTAAPPPSTEQARAAGVAAGMNILQSEVNKQAAKPYQMTMPERTPIGIMFLAPVNVK